MHPNVMPGMMYHQSESNYAGMPSNNRSFVERNDVNSLEFNIDLFRSNIFCRINPGMYLDEYAYQDPPIDVATTLKAEVRLSDAGYYPVTIQEIDLHSPDGQLLVSFENEL